MTAALTLALALLSLGAGASCSRARLDPGSEAPNKVLGVRALEKRAPLAGQHWAVLIAGSNGWGNYRHQADVCHAYQVLRRGGLLERHLILMIYDDLADNPENPFPGKVFNRPGGPNVYRDLRPDYTGADVNAQTFLAVLTGNEAAVKGRGSGRVVRSGRNDRLFVFYSDHGATGVLGMPEGPFLYADELLGALRKMHQRKRFLEAVLYIEACESGSMFEGVLDNTLAVYATTAANAEESSWGTYCPGIDPTVPDAITTCLGDLYSVAWMENAEDCDTSAETLQAQFKRVRERTSNNFTYDMGSHAMQYGDLSIDAEPADEYEGNVHSNDTHPLRWAALRRRLRQLHQQRRRLQGAGAQHSGRQLLLRAGGPGRGFGSGFGGAVGPRGGGVPMRAQQRPEGEAGARDAAAAREEVLLHPARFPHNVEQRDADLVPLRHAAASLDPQRRARARAELAAALAERTRVDGAALQSAARLLAEGGASPLLVQSLGVEPAAAALLTGVAAAGGAASSAAGPLAPLASRLVHAAPSATRGAGLPVVDSFDCLRAMVAEWEAACGRMDTYSMRHTRYLANLCNAGLAPLALRGTLQC